MSRYDRYQTQFKDPKALQDVLREMYGAVEVHNEPQALMDWHGHRRSDKAEIIVRRAHLFEASNDLGFEARSDGTYSALISDYDRAVGLNDEWMAKLTQGYNQEALVPHLERQGFISQSVVTDENGDVHLTMSRTR